MSPDGTPSLRRLHDADLPPPDLIAPRNALPVVLSIPHSGRDYPNWLIASAWGGRAALEPLEDPLVDRLAWRALARGFGAVIARCPRAATDCNRAADEIDPMVIDRAPPAPLGPRARAGLGIVPSRTGHGPLWRRPITLVQLEQRLDRVHRPFHRAIAAAIAAARRREGSALLLDLHSMPAPARRPVPADIVIGDRHGASAAGWVSEAAAEVARRHGFSVARNDPFAGGHIIACHGRPAQGVHALQVEVARPAYCQIDQRSPGPGFERVAKLIEALAIDLGEALAGAGSIAAE